MPERLIRRASASAGFAQGLHLRPHHAYRLVGPEDAGHPLPVPVALRTVLQCGCIASMVLAAVGHHKVLPGVSAGQLFFLSDLIGKGVNKLRSSRDLAEPAGYSGSRPGCRRRLNGDIHSHRNLCCVTDPTSSPPLALILTVQNVSTVHGTNRWRICRPSTAAPQNEDRL